MTTTPSRTATRRLHRADVAEAVSALESDFGRLPPGMWDPRHHYLLDALDRGEHDRFVIHTEGRITAMVHLGMTGTVVPAGDPAAAAALADHVERSRWRILIGDEPIAQALLDLTTRSPWWRRGVSTRIQRLMTVESAADSPVTPVDGFRRASRADLDHLEDFACRLHVEDRMGPPLTGGARQGVRHRMADSVDRGMTWVVVRRGVPVAKADLSLYSHLRGAQIAGVYVDRAHRGSRIATGMIATLSQQLLERGLPVVSLHVRDDNTPALMAYRRAGFVERGRWVLALR